MPGIVGIISQRSSAGHSALVNSMVKCLIHEPFYTDGTYINEELGQTAAEIQARLPALLDAYCWLKLQKRERTFPRRLADRPYKVANDLRRGSR
jgi:hypothetical protein